MPYPMVSWKAANFTFSADSPQGFTHYEYSQTSSARLCTKEGFAKGDTIKNRSTCFPEARAEWRPEEWASDELVPSLPRNVTSRQIDRACDGITIHVARPEWVASLRKLWQPKYAPASWSLYTSTGERIHDRDHVQLQFIPDRSGAFPDFSKSPLGAMIHSNATARRRRKAQCVKQLKSFTPRVCSLRDVLVWGHARRMMSANGSIYYLPPEVRASQRAHDQACPANCRARPKNVVSCGGHAVIGRNLMGVAYFHTMYETFASVAYMLELLQGVERTTSTTADTFSNASSSNGAGGPSGRVPMRERPRLLENMCIPADGGQQHMNMRSRSCFGPGVAGSKSYSSFFGPGPTSFISAIINFLGIDDAQLQHYPYVRQWEGPSIHLDKVTFDCSASNFRNFWHAVKLREILHKRMGQLHANGGLSMRAGMAPPLDNIVLMDRNACEPPPKNSTNSRTAAAKLPPPTCKSGRGVKHHKSIWQAIEKAFTPRRYKTVDFTGSEPYHEQAKAFHRAAVVVGPHGAQLANIVFCQKRSAVVEFVAAKRKSQNSALYAGYASSVFGLDYWVVVSNAADGSYDDITAADVLPVVEYALENANSKRSQAAKDKPRPWQLMVGDEESNLVSGYGSHIEAWPAGWRRR